MNIFKRMLSLSIIMIILFSSFTVSFADTKSISNFTIRGTDYSLIVLQDDNEKRIVKTITSDGNEILGTFDKINKTITIENGVNKSNAMRTFASNGSNEIVIDLKSSKQSSSIITPYHVGDEVILSTSTLFGSLYYRAEYVNEWVTYNFKTDDDYVNTGAVNTQDPSQKNIIRNGDAFKYNVENADTFGGNFKKDLTTDLITNGTMKSDSEIKDFVENTGYGLAKSVASSDDKDYEAPLLTALFAFTDVAISYVSYLIKGCVAYANIHNCNTIIDAVKDLI